MTLPSPFHADPVVLRALAKLTVPVPCPEDRMLFRQGDECSGLFVLYTGQANLELRCDMEEVVASFPISDGSLLGLPAALSGEKYSLTAIVKAGSEVGFITRSSLLHLMKSDSALALKALQVLAAQTSAARAALVEVLARRRKTDASGNGSIH